MGDQRTLESKMPPKTHARKRPAAAAAEKVHEEDHHTGEEEPAEAPSPAASPGPEAQASPKLERGASFETALSPDQLRAWKRIKARAGYCGLCCEVLRDFTGHASRRPNCRAHKDSRGHYKLSSDEWAQIEADFQQEIADPQNAKLRRVEKAKERHEKNWKTPSQQERATKADQEYRLNFGIKSGQTIKEVLESDPEGKYFQRLMSLSNNILDCRPDLRDALEKEGLLQKLLEARPRLMKDRAHKVLARAEEAQDKPEHPEVKKLRKLQQIEASQVLLGEVKEAALAAMPDSQAEPAALAVAASSLAGPEQVKAKRRYKPTSRILLPHCEVCGSIDHKRQTCPLRDLQGSGNEDRQLSLVRTAYLKNKQIAATASRLKYTRIAVRTAGYEERPSCRARASVARTWLSYSRAMPGQLADMLEEDGLLINLVGVPCPREKCRVSKQEGYLSSKKTLGQRCHNDEKGHNIELKTVWHRCDTCSVKQQITLHNPIFAGFTGKSAHGVSMALLAFWNCVEGASLVFTIRQLNIHENTCRAYYDRAKVIMAAGAHRLQREVTWGTGTSKTVEVEIDCTVICKWRREEDGHTVYYYYVYMGARQRGSVDKLALMPCGISRSVDEGRVNKESSGAYHKFCREVFGTGKKMNLVKMTDACNTYFCECDACLELFAERHHVNHSRKPIRENTRPLDNMLLDADTGERGDGMAGTQTLDGEFGHIKEHFPHNLTASSPEAMARCDIEVRAQQFRRMTSTGDRWQAAVIM